MRTLQEIDFLRELYKLGAANNFGETGLLVLGDDHTIVGSYRQGQNHLSELTYYELEETDRENQLANLIELLLDRRFETLYVLWSGYQAMLVPLKIDITQKELLQFVYGLPSQVYFSDSLSDLDLKVIYSSPSKLYSRLQNLTQDLEFTHSYSATLRIYNGYTTPDQVELCLSPKKFSVCVKKDHQVVLVQTYAYAFPLDVIYFLLKIFNEFNLDQNECLLLVAGLIDKDSELMETMKDYFLNIHFTKGADFAIKDSAHPAHYFTSIYNLAACVL